MESETVQIVIKAPNQMTEDQTIQCNRTWTVSQLKNILCIEYPTHPKPENQKLIYSGKLLNDNMILSDILKTFGGHEYTTLHLVCSIREKPKVRIIPRQNSTEISANRSNQSTTSVEGTNSQFYIGNSLPIRDANPCLFGHELASPVNNLQYIYSNQDISQRMLLIQRAYVEYMNNYIHSINNGRYRLELRHNFEPRIIENNNREIPQNHVEHDVEDEGVAQRDWLEWIYIITRLIVLFFVVYFYSSPLRFIAVVTVALILLNMDVERWRRRQEIPDIGVNNNRPIDESIYTAQQMVAAVNEAHQNTHLINIFSTFITSFFLSLIPEQRAV